MRRRVRKHTMHLSRLIVAKYSEYGALAAHRTARDVQTHRVNAGAHGRRTTLRKIFEHWWTGIRALGSPGPGGGGQV
jgi:hypothetical protein